MSRQDRQGVRTPADIERKYDLGAGAESKGLTAKQAERLNQLSQLVNQYMNNINAKLQELENTAKPPKTDNTLKIDANGLLGVNTTDLAEKGNVLPITSNAVATALENIGVGGGTAPPTQTVVVKPLADKKILCLGDELMGNDQVNGVPSYLAEYSGATVYNGGFARSGFARRTTGSANVCFDLPNIIDAMVSQNWSVHETQAESVSNSTQAYWYFPDTVAMLKSIDFSQIDAITLAYGTIDWSDGKNADYVISELKASIDKIQLYFPEMRILVITPIWRYFTMGSSSSDDYTEYGEGFTLREWAKKIEDAAKEKHVSVLNAYENMPLSYNNASTYFDKSSSNEDGLHHINLNEKGNQMYAEIICGKLCTMFAHAGVSISGGELHKECISAEELANLSTLLN